MVLFQDRGRIGTAGLLWNCLTKFPFLWLGRQTEKHTRALGKAGFM